MGARSEQAQAHHIILHRILRLRLHSSNIRTDFVKYTNEEQEDKLDYDERGSNTGCVTRSWILFLSSPTKQIGAPHLAIDGKRLCGIK